MLSRNFSHRRYDKSWVHSEKHHVVDIVLNAVMLKIVERHNWLQMGHGLEAIRVIQLGSHFQSLARQSCGATTDGKPVLQSTVQLLPRALLFQLSNQIYPNARYLRHIIHLERWLQLPCGY